MIGGAGEQDAFGLLYLWGMAVVSDLWYSPEAAMETKSSSATTI